MVNKAEIELIDKFSNALSKLNLCQYKLKKNNKNEEIARSYVNLFFSFDIVNSTKYKTLTEYWPDIIKTLLIVINKSVKKEEGLKKANIWRIIGDEIIFEMRVSSIEELKIAIDSIFYITQRISANLKNGTFFDDIEKQSITKSKIELFKIQNNLSIKSAAWIAAINKYNTSSYFDNIVNTYIFEESGVGIKEYLGKDIDTGFRIKEQTFSKRLIISIEIAALLKQEVYGNPGKGSYTETSEHQAKIENFYKKIKIMDYKKLKGVWGENLYPLIFYHNEEKTSDYNGEYKKIKFEDSFDYDESQRNDLVKKYYKIIGLDNFICDDDNILKKEMYNPKYAIDKIVETMHLYKKIKYINDLFINNDKVPDTCNHIIELHCAVVCCDYDKNRILIMKRKEDREINPGKWEFGCSKASSDEKLEETIKKQYKDYFGVDIELYKPKKRIDSQPKPLFIFELEKEEGMIAKGTIFAAKILNKDKCSIMKNFRENNRRYVELKWLYKDELNNFVLDNKDNLITDFKNTAEYVFNNMKNWFGEE